MQTLKIEKSNYTTMLWFICPFYLEYAIFISTYYVIIRAGSWDIKIGLRFSMSYSMESIRELPQISRTLNSNSECFSKLFDPQEAISGLS